MNTDRNLQSFDTEYSIAWSINICSKHKMLKKWYLNQDYILRGESGAWNILAGRKNTFSQEARN